MNTLVEMLSPSFLLFPAVLGSVVLGLVCPLVGAFLILRRTVFLGLTLPQIAAAGIAFTFWLQHAGVLPRLGGGGRLMGVLGSLLSTLLGIGLLGYLEQRGKGLAEGRLAAAYAFAGALTILFIVFNPAGEVEILSLLKGEVIAMSTAELKVLIVTFGIVLLGMLLFRREFLLSSFDRDLAFLLKGGTRHWDVLLYLLAGLAIAVGVIMAGPLLVFGFLVLPPLAARPLIRGMAAFLSVSSMIGVVMAVLGFYLSYRLDLPLGPTDVALGCGLVFLAYGMSRLRLNAVVAVCLTLLAPALALRCASTAVIPFPEPALFSDSTVWMAPVNNSTGRALTFPGVNPLESLREMAGQALPEPRKTVMDVVRESLRKELERRGVKVSYPDRMDNRLSRFPANKAQAAEVARNAGLSGHLFLTNLHRWSRDSREFVAVLVDYRVLSISDGRVLWERRIRRAVPTPSATHLGQAYDDAANVVAREIFESS